MERATAYSTGFLVEQCSRAVVIPWAAMWFLMVRTMVYLILTLTRNITLAQAYEKCP